MSTPDSDTTLVARSILLLARRLRAETAAQDLTGAALALLATAHRLGPVPAVRLAAEERLAPQSLTRLLQGLEGNGFIVRTPDPADRRNKLISITPAGGKALRAALQPRRDWLARSMAEHLSPAECDILEEAAHLMLRLSGEPGD
ncbi:MAG: MarR family transcriptional regulator [Hyphomonas sp.]